MKSKYMFSISSLLSAMAFSCFLGLAYGQWTSHFIDQNLDGAYAVYVADIDSDNDLDVIAAGYNVADVIWYESSVGVEEKTAPNQSSAISVVEIFPNPFSNRTEIRYNLGHSVKKAELKIYNITGQIVKEWDDEVLKQSNHITWDGRDEYGKRLPIGVYILKLSADQSDISIKLLLVR